MYFIWEYEFDKKAFHENKQSNILSEWIPVAETSHGGVITKSEIML